MKHTEISTLGEFGLIQHVERIVGRDHSNNPAARDLIQGISDDAAVYKPTPGKVQLLTTDTFVEGVHFDLTYTSMKHLGWKVMAANLSDIAAMGGSPRYAVIALSLPRKVSVEMVEDFYEGVSFSMRKHGFLLVGGDTSGSSGNLAITVSLVGEASEDRVIYRRGARSGDYLCVTGHLGASIAGLKILQREKNRYMTAGDRAEFHPRLEEYAPAVEKHLMPKPRLDFVPLMTESVKVNCMIDISDGLASDLHHICELSGVGAAVYERNLPVEAVTQRIAAELNERPADYALHGGEEYELLFSISDREYEKLEGLTNDVTIIGRIQEKDKGIICISEQGEIEPLEAAGWDHFRAVDPQTR